MLTGRGQSENLFAGLLESAPDAIVIVGVDGQIVLVNAQCEALFGYRREEMIGSQVEMLVPERLLNIHRGHRDTYTSDPHPRAMGIGLALTARRKDGSEVPVEISLSPLETGSELLISAAVRDVTERRRIQDELERAKAEAENANHAKNDFLSRMSHELRTPLNAVLGFGQLLELDALTPSQDESLHQIMKAGRHLLDLIDEVLDITRIEAGKLPVSNEPVPVNPALIEALDLMRPSASEKTIALSTELTNTEGRYVMADRQRLRQVLLNLLSNAIKYNRTGGSVTLTTGVMGDLVTIAVTDSGRGISREHIDRVFQPFDRLGAEASDVEGTGLGLALSHGLIDTMGGKLTALSTAGVGSVFTISLLAVDAPRLVGEDAARSAAPALVTSEKLMTVLYIEDNLSNLRLIERALELRPGVRLLSAMQAKLGLELARQHRPDLVLLDLHLPDLSGEEALRILQSEPETAEIPVVIVTADATPTQMHKLLAAGATDYLTKPLDIGRLLALVDASAP
ncbi:MAG: PAS domain S-box protein [Acidimicrobiia bacterium]